MTTAWCRKIYKKHGGKYVNGVWEFPTNDAARIAMHEVILERQRRSDKPMTPAERKAKQRAKLAIEGLSEVRGIYAKPEHHERIKKYAAKVK